MSEWLKRVASSPLANRCVLRGSQLTQQWIPERKATDVDHLLLGEGWTVGKVRELLDGR